MIRTRLTQLLIGTPRPFGDEGELSAIVKTATDQPLMLGVEGLEGNEVADPIHHGGRDKAVHLYPAEHYQFWQEKYPDLAVLDEKGAFGENLSCSGMTEQILCLGDIFRIGEALIQCSHARQPCWKLNHRFGKRDVLKTVVRTTKSGSYFRVLEPGMIRAGDELIQLEQPFPEWPLDRLFGLLVAGEHEGQGAELRFLSENPVLAKTWRVRAAQLAAN
ncbi:MOSC domain-containing protein [Parasphingorhabdus sp.]|uniref:MOSC domain-containing protein n=1 Tax=Parasphingorhabdus sp. TaxID=2709688 RepID=UPI0030017A6F